MTLRFYVKSNLEILGGQNLQFWSFWEALYFEKFIPTTDTEIEKRMMA